MIPGPATAIEKSSRIESVLKALLYGAAIVLYLLPYSSLQGMAAAVAAAWLAMPLAGLTLRRGLRLPLAAALALLGGVGAALLGTWVLRSHLVPSLFGVQTSLVISDMLTFGLGAMAAVFLLRLLGQALRLASLLEVLFVAGSAVLILADHRNRMLNRPRIFSDWAWTLGLDPGTVLTVVGVAVTVASVLLFLRGQRLLKILTTLLLLLALGTTYFLLGDRRIEQPKPLDALGLSGKGKGKGGGSGGGSSDNPFKDNYDRPPPTPVAIAILRDDFDPRMGMMYFRQLALSSYNGHHLVSGTDRGWDRDLIVDFPQTAPLLAAPVQNEADHLPVPTTMYLLVDHPQPPALAHAVRITPVPNPNPQQFVAAYDVRSRVLTVPTQRLLGRRSIPSGWSARMRAHYTALPSDPRYRALADIIVREVDPRYANDDLARAYAIKRYLEQEGFYTMRSTHASKDDPTGSFLFGSLHGYCVHFAHAAAYLFRSQGIASRVALGYAVQTTKRAGGTAVLIMSDRAHAWPEIHLEGIGWVTFDIYPEHTDMPPPQLVDYDLEKLLGELARNDKTAGLSPEGRPVVIPWGAMARGTALLLVALLALSYLIKAWRRLAPRLRRGRAYPRLAYIAMLDRLSDLGQHRQRGETRERHAARLAGVAPHLIALTRAHLARALGRGQAEEAQLRAFADLVREVDADLQRNVHPARRLLGLLNPVGWVWTR